jgi:pimeloyl-ACP methyl ester carboxylesterase
MCVFLPGYPDTLHVFSRALALLPATCGYLAVDFPGQGGSAPRPNCVSPDERARWLERVLLAVSATPSSEQGLERIRVFGHDMGAHTALALAGQIVVDRLVLSHALLNPRAPTSASIAMLRASRAYRVLLPTFPDLVVTRCLSTFLPRADPLTRAIEDDVRQAFSDGGARETVGFCDAAETWLAHPFDPSSLRGLRPVLLWGDHEHHFPVVHADSFALRVPSDRVSVAGGHHWLCWHEPKAVLDALLG